MAELNVRVTKIVGQVVETDPLKIDAVIHFIDVDRNEVQEPYLVGDIQDITNPNELLPTGRGGNDFHWL